MKPKDKKIKLKKLKEYGYFWFLQYPLDRIIQAVDKLRSGIDKNLQTFIENKYRPSLAVFLKYRYINYIFKI